MGDPTTRRFNSRMIFVGNFVANFVEGEHLAVIMQCQSPLTLSLSPSDGARESLHRATENSLISEQIPSHGRTSLSPFDGERVGVRGSSTA